MVTDENTCSQLWQNIILSTITTMFSLLMVMILYGKLCKKIEKHSCKHTARKQPGLKTMKPESTVSGEEHVSEKKPDSHQENVSHWLSEQTQGQQTKEPNVPVNSCMTGRGSESSQQALLSQHSGAEDVSYTTLVFGDPKRGTSTRADYEDLKAKDHYENVSPQEWKAVF